MRQFAAYHSISIFCDRVILGAVIFELVPPSLVQRPPARADAFLEVFAHAVRHQELRLFRPAIPALGQADFFFAQWFAVRRTRVLLVRRTICDMGIDNDQRRPILRVFERREGTLEQLQIVGVAHSRHVPAIASEACCDVIAIGQRGVAFDGDVVVIIDPTQVGEFEMTC